MSLGIEAATVRLLAHLEPDEGPVEEMIALVEALAAPLAAGLAGAELDRARIGGAMAAAGELLARRSRAEGALDAQVVGGVVIHPFQGRDAGDPFGLIARGWGLIESASGSAVRRSERQPASEKP